MPTRRLPRNNSERNAALTRVTERMDQTPPPIEVPFTPATLLRLNVVQPDYQQKLGAAAAALGQQAQATAIVNETRIMASYLIADMIEAMQRAVRRKAFLPSVRAYYQLPVGESHIPRIRTEAEVLEWGAKIIKGETDRVAAGGSAITFPGLPEVQGAFNAFKDANLAQAERKTEYDNAQQAISNSNTEVDKLILKLWNESETFFDEGDRPAMRRKTREWGVFYVPSSGETPSAEDFSLMGKATLPDGTPLADVALAASTGNFVVETTTDAKGNFYFGVLTPSTYQLLATKEGFDDVLQTGIVITEDQLTELNITMQPTEPEPEPAPEPTPGG